MEMTYAALAKSLGITLKSSTSSASTATSIVGSLPTSGSAPITSSPALTSVPNEDLQKYPSSMGKVEEQEEKAQTNEVSSKPPPSALGDAEEIRRERKSSGDPEDSVDVSMNADADANGDSDIASSRSYSPNSARAVDSSQEENATEAMRSQSSEATSVSQGTDIDTEAGILGSKGPTKAPSREDITDEQLHHAKVLVLDLLGWGVPPEYLLQRGISHALLYTVFTDLRLRLPDAIIADCVKLVSAQS